MSKKRPGVAAAVRLASNLTDRGLWKRVERQYDDIRSKTLVDAEKACLASLGADDDSLEELAKSQLMDIVKWKFSVGKPRNQLLGLLRSNTEDSVIECSQNAIKLARDINFEKTVSSATGELTVEGEKSVKMAMEELTKLKGVGPATATAALCRVRPDIFCYMYDEVIDCFEPKRDYTVNVYLRINSKCLQLAHTLGGDGWTTARVAKVLWIASRVLANGSEGDLTASPSSSGKENSKSSKQEEQPKQTSSRKRRKT